MWIWWAVAHAATVEGSASPSGYQTALINAFYRAIEDHPEVEAVSFSGAARGTPVFGTNAQLAVTWTCGGQTHTDDLAGIRGKAGETDWNATADQVVTLLIRRLPCEAAPSAPERPDRVTGYANPEAYGDALELSLLRELDARPEITAVEFRASSRGALMTGPTVQATATFTCGGQTHEVVVDELQVTIGEGSWGPVADRVVARLLRDLSCEASP